MSTAAGPTGEELRRIARRIRVSVVEMSHRSGAPHLGSSLSCVDVLVAAYFGAFRLDPAQAQQPDRDRFILSKGHGAAALYATLAHRGHFALDWLETYATDGDRLAEHPGPECAPGVEAATGSLGHGLGLGSGMALAARITGRDYRVGVLLSDGECNEGSTWEAAMFAPARRLDNLVVVVDHNKWQATGRTADVLALEPLRAKWEAFGWEAEDIDGHDLDALVQSMRRGGRSNRPLALVAHTTKGKGVSFMEDDNNWHYRIPTAEEVERARGELEAGGP